MNQILVTEKLYITPELKRKKKMYKIKFCISIFLICLLFSYYIYAESVKTESEAVSKQILADLENKKTNSIDNETLDNTTKNVVNDVIIVTLSKTEAEEVEDEIMEPPIIEEDQEEQNTYTTESGEKYTTDSILTIPSIDITYPVLSETSEELLKISLNKYWGNGPNEIGNYCIVGHNYASGKLFGKLSQMEIGDIAILEDMSGRKITYEAYDKFTVDPTDVSCTSQLTNGKKEMTLITCKEYGTKRLVIKCREI